MKKDAFLRERSRQKMIQKNREKWKNKVSYTEDEYQVYIGLKWDYEHGQLPQAKEEYYNKIKEKYENEK